MGSASETGFNLKAPRATRLKRKKPAFAGFLHSYSENGENIPGLVQLRQRINLISAIDDVVLYEDWFKPGQRALLQDAQVVLDLP